MIDTNSSIIIIEQIDLGKRNGRRKKKILLYWYNNIVPIYTYIYIYISCNIYYDNI